MHRYDIRDVWPALKLAFKNLSYMLLLFWLLLFVFIGSLGELGDKILSDQFIVVVHVAILIQSIFIYFANRKYIIDIETGSITFPRSDMENSIIAILLFFPFWNLIRTKTVNSEEIENIYIDTKRWSTKHQILNGSTSTGKIKYKTKTIKHVKYNLNLAGTFGSAKLEFDARQKRDEVRNAIQQCVKHYTGKNIDRKVAEFA